MPDWMAYVRQNLRLPTLQPGREAQIVEDLAQQLGESYQEALSSGISEREAYDRACRHISDWSELSEELAGRERARMPVLYRLAANASSRNSASSFGSFLYGAWRDVVYGLRTLRRNAAFTALAISTVAMGVAATVASFSVLYAALWRPMPYPRSQDLAAVSASNVKEGVVAGAASAADFYDWRAENKCFSAITAYTNWAFNLTGGDYPERINGALVSPDFFAVLQILPLQGRTFGPDEDEAGKSDVAVVSDRLWRRLFGTGQLKGQTVTLNGSKVTVIGTMPSGFAFPNKQIEIWIPLSLSPADR